MKTWIVAALFLAGGLGAPAQDVGWLVEQAPTVSMILVKTLEKAPAFSARVEVTVSGPADPVPSGATGTMQAQSGSLRWDVKLADVKSAQLSQNARAIVRQINGDRFVLLTRSDLHANYLVLPGADAYLEQALPELKSSGNKIPAVSEKIEGRACSRQAQRLVQANGSVIEVVVWRAKDLKNLPVQVQMTESGEKIQVTFRDIQIGAIAPDEFRISGGLSKYNSMEDLMQAVVLERMKKRIGL
jgi:hypothetical protein